MLWQRMQEKALWKRFVCRWYGTDEWNDKGSKEKISKMEKCIEEQGTESESLKDKDDGVWVRGWSHMK